MATTFIQLNRRFKEFTPGTVEEEGGRYIHHWMGGTLGWDELLAFALVVMFAEGGSGKTQELIHKTKDLTRQGEFAFFIALEQLVDLQLTETLQVDAAEFERWKASSETATFFLDSVDEAKLRSPSDFRKALARVRSALGAAAGRARFVVSTRPHAWVEETDRQAMMDAFGVAEQVQQTGSAGGTEAIKSHVFVQLLPLDIEQIRVFARSSGVSEVQEFIEELDRADAMKYATRPVDLPALIDLWEKKKAIGSYREVVESNIDLKLRYVKEGYPSLDKAREREGVARLAAAVTLTGKAAIAIPGKTPLPAMPAAVDPTRVLMSWTPADIEALLAKPLFDEAGLGTLRFHHRSVREYLTSEWLARLSTGHYGVADIKDLLAGQPYGSLPFTTSPVLRPVSGWLATVNGQFGAWLAELDPITILEHGDSSALPVEQRAALLRHFADKYKERSDTPLRMDAHDVRRLAHKGLSEVIRELLTGSTGHDDLQILLCRVVRDGKIADLSAEMLALAKDLSCSTTVRAIAASTMDCAPAEVRRVFAQALMAEAGKWPRDVVGQGLEALGPEGIGIADVIAVCEAMAEEDEHRSDQLSLGLPRYVGALDIDDLTSFIGAVLPLMARPPLVYDTHVSERYAWLDGILHEAVSRLLSLQTCGPYPPVLPAAIAVLDRLHRHSRRFKIDWKGFQQVVKGRPDLQDDLHWHCVELLRREGKQPNFAVYVFWELLDAPSEADFPRFVEAYNRKTSREDKLLVLDTLGVIARNSKRSTDLFQELTALVEDDAEFRQLVDTWENPPPPSETLQKYIDQSEAWRKQDEKRKAEEELARTTWITDVKADPSVIGSDDLSFSGPGFKHVFWLYQEMEPKKATTYKYARSNVDVLMAEFGPGVVARFTDVVKSGWKGVVTPLRSEPGVDDTKVTYGYMVAVSGVDLLAKSSSDWWRSLSNEQIERAVRHALREINGFPDWLWQLLDHREDIVAPILEGELRWELSQSSVSSYIISAVRHGGQDQRANVRKIVLAAMTAEINNASGLRELLTVALRHPVPDRLIGLIREGAQTEGPCRLGYLAAWMLIDASAAWPVAKMWTEVEDDAARDRLAGLLSAMTDLEGVSYYKSHLRADLLEDLVKLSFAIDADEESEFREEGWISEFDRRGKCRSHALGQLQGLPGVDTYRALTRLSALAPTKYLQDRLLVMAERRAADDLDAERGRWTDIAVGDVGERLLRKPVTAADLLDVGLARLRDLREELECGDNSEAPLWRKAEDERQLRISITNHLNKMAHSQFFASPEEEKADLSRTDIRLHAPPIIPLPLELKIAGQWQTHELLAAIRNQLVGKYMKQSENGVLVVVNCERDRKDHKTWQRPDGTRMGFSELVAMLSVEADCIAKESGKRAIKVVGIDLTHRAPGTSV